MLKQKGRKWLCLVMSVILLSILPGDSVSAHMRLTFGKLVTTVAKQSYIAMNDNHVTTSFLAAEGDGYLRVAFFLSAEHQADIFQGCIDLPAAEKLVIERYNSDFEIQSVQYLTPELPRFGGFYAGEDFYYMVYGQENAAESDDVEVIRIVKYDKNWNRIQSASIYGANTHTPFEGGNLRFAEYGGFLYIRTAHTMYRANDGKNHQANMTIEIRESDMKVSANSAVSNSSSGYVSHSFNQFILVDDDARVVALDHGDAYPRAALLGRYTAKAGQDPLSKKYVSTSVLQYRGATGVNNTHASVGGLEYSATHYLTAGNSVIQDENYQQRKVRNVYITATKREAINKENTTFTWISDYTEDSGLSASTPLLVKRSADSFVMLWSIFDSKTPHSADIDSAAFSYVFLDGEGKPVSSVYTQEGYLSDCQPIVKDNCVVWYALCRGTLTFYQLKEDGSVLTKVVTPSLDLAENTETGIRLSWKSVPGAANYRLYRRDRHSDEDFVPIGETADTAYIDTHAYENKPYTTYCYSIQALNADGEEMFGSFDCYGLEIKCSFPVKEPADSSSDQGSDSSDEGSSENAGSDSKSEGKTNPNARKILKITSAGKQVVVGVLVGVYGEVSLRKATVKVKIGNGKYKKAKVSGKKFYIKYVEEYKPNKKIKVKVSKPGYKTVIKTV